MSIAIGVVHDEKVDAMWVLSMLALRRVPGIGPTIFVQGGPGNFDVARNKVVRHFLEATGDDVLLMIDTDHVFNVPDALTIAENTAGVRSGAYFVDDRPPRPCFSRYGEDGRLHTVTDWNEAEIIPVDACGAGFMAIRREVFLSIGDDEERGGPWFRMDKTGPAGQVLEPDHAFCLRAKEAGFPVEVDTGVLIGHVKPHILGYGGPE